MTDSNQIVIYKQLQKWPS